MAGSYYSNFRVEVGISEIAVEDGAKLAAEKYSHGEQSFTQ